MNILYSPRQDTTIRPDILKTKRRAYQRWLKLIVGGLRFFQRAFF